MLTEILGIIPAIVFPAATFFQFIKIIRSRDVSGVSIFSWILFGIANLTLYFYVGKFAEIQAIFSMLLTALLDFIIAFFIWRWKPRSP